MNLRTFFVTTTGPKGPRGGRGMTRKFVVLANDDFEAKQRALANKFVSAGSSVTEILEVTPEAGVLYVGI